MDKEEAFEKYNFIKSYIWKHGEKKGKKHGNWILLKIGREAFLQMDSWNESIHYGIGPQYNYWIGFGGWEFLGGYWGEFTKGKDDRFINYIYNKIKGE